MKREDIKLEMKCCNEFLCGECPYDKEYHKYTMRCIHILMTDIRRKL